MPQAAPRVEPEFPLSLWIRVHRDKHPFNVQNLLLVLQAQRQWRSTSEGRAREGRGAGLCLYRSISALPCLCFAVFVKVRPGVTCECLSFPPLYGTINCLPPAPPEVASF